MKKYLLLSILGLFSAATVISCEDRNEDVIVQENVIPNVMTDVTGTLNQNNDYTIRKGITINSTDVVLVYRNINSNTNGSAVWQLLPRTEFIGSGREIDYNFLFDTQNVEIYTEANFDQSLLNSTEAAEYLVNQRFRIVLIPATAGKNANVKYSDYNSVIRYYNIQDRE